MTEYVGEGSCVALYYHMYFLVWDGSKVFTPKVIKNEMKIMESHEKH